MIDRLGLTILCVPVRVGELEVLIKFGIWRFNLAVATEVLTSRVMEPPLPIRIISVRVWKTSRRVCDDLLREHRLAHAQILSDYRNILRNQMFNWTDCALDDLWDELVLQYFCQKSPLVM